jgi:DNA helicase HerA-like ATPase
MSQSILVGKSERGEQRLLLSMANRHGLIAGATGTGKTVTLRVLAEGFSRAGVSVFMADVKGDLAGLSQPGQASAGLASRLEKLGIADWNPEGLSCVFWDLFGKQGHPVRATISEVGPFLLGRLLNLNDTQSGVLNIVFRVADEAGMPILDLKDLQAMLVHVGENAQQLTLQYGNVSVASIGAIQRSLLSLLDGDQSGFFGEPALNIDDLLQTDAKGRGIINILSAEKLMMSPRMYSTFLLWMLSELFERLPEVGDIDRPKLVFFFDEAHLLFDDAPKVLIDKIEQVVRLIRSKGVGVYFVSQSPLDIADSVLAQLGNRVQHALRAFTARDQKAVKATAETFRSDGSFDLREAVGALGIGEALVSMLDEQGIPSITERSLIAPPASRLGAISEQERGAVMSSSLVRGVYERSVDRESAYEMLQKRIQTASEDSDERFEPTAAPQTRRQQRQGPLEAMLMSVARSIGSQLGRSISRGVFGAVSRPSRRRR